MVSDGAALESTLRVELGVGAAATVREVVVLGRHGQRGGRYAGALDVVVDGVPLLAHTTLLDGADPGLCGPAGTAGARAVGTLVLRRCGAVTARRRSPASRGRPPTCGGRGRRSTAPGAVLLAVGTPSAVAAVLDAAAACGRCRDRSRGTSRPAGSLVPAPRRPVSARPRVRRDQRCWMPPYTCSNVSVSTTRRSATIAARYSAQSGCSPASVR